MFQVQPVRSRELQAQIASALNCPFCENTYAFFAGELSEDNTTITALIGMCQFTYSPEIAVIQSIAYPEECAADEAVFIMVRTVMNFIYRAGIPVIAAEDDSASEKFLKSLGFRKQDDRWQIDLKKFYRSPCHYKPDEENA